MRDKEEYNKQRRKRRKENKQLIEEFGELKTGRFSKEEDEYILENYFNLPIKEIGYGIERTATSVYERIQKLRKKGLIVGYKQRTDLEQKENQQYESIFKYGDER